MSKLVYFQDINFIYISEPFNNGNMSKKLCIYDTSA